MAETRNNDETLFREEVIEHHCVTWLSEAIIVSPVSFSVMAVFGVLVVLALVLFGYFGTYTKRATVVGQLVPVGGVIRIYPPQGGTVLEEYVQEGKRVRAGEALFVISSDKNSTIGAPQASISSSIRAQKSLLDDKLSIVEAMGEQQRHSLVVKLSRLREEQANVASMLHTQEQRVAVAQRLADKYRELLSQQFVSESDVQNREAELLDQQSRLIALRRDGNELAIGVAATQDELRDLPLKTNNSVVEVKSQLQTVKANLSESEGKRGAIIVAPVGGIITAVTRHTGQWVEAMQPIVTILPRSRRLFAELYPTSKAVGFVKIGDTVELRYEAFPYQKYGIYEGHVASISRTTLTAVELSSINDVLFQRSDPFDRGAPLYRITVTLDDQEIWVDSKRQNLQAGMLLEASILQEKRRLYEWVMEPLYSVIGTPKGEKAKVH